MRRLTLSSTTAGAIAAPIAGAIAMFHENGILKTKDSSGNVAAVLDDATLIAETALSTSLQAALDANPRVRVANGAYTLTQYPTATHNYSPEAQPCIVMPMDLADLDFGGARITVPAGKQGFVYWPWSYPHTADYMTLTADIAAGSFVATVNSTASASAGDWVCVQAGHEASYDTVECLNWYFAKIVAVLSSTSVRLDAAMPKAFTVADVTNAINKRITILPDEVVRAKAMRNVHLIGTSAAQPESGLYFSYFRNMTFERITGEYMGAGLFVGKYLENVRFVQCGSNGVNASQASYGSAFAFAECRDVFLEQCFGGNVLTGIKCEAGAEVGFDRYSFHNNYPGDGSTVPASNTVKVLQALGRSVIRGGELLITGNGGFTIAETTNGVSGYDGSVGIRDLTIRTTAHGYSLGLKNFSGTVLMEVAGTREEFRLPTRRTWRRKFLLKDGMSATTLYGPPGLVLSARAYTTSDVTVGTGGLERFYLGKNAGGAANGNDLATDGLSGVKLVAGSWVDIPVTHGTIAGAQWTYKTNNQQVIITTNASAGLNPKDAFVEIEMEYVIEESAKTFSYSETHMRAEGGDYDIREALIASSDIASIAAGATATHTVTITDMADTDIFVGWSVAGGYGGLTLVQFECGTGQGTFTITNSTGSPIDLSARDIRVLFAKGHAGA